MASISWNEVRERALKFSRTWGAAVSERADKQTFWNEFFEVFGLLRRSVASFEEPVVNIRGHYGAIDLFWPGVLLVEHKSAGKKLNEASSQAFEYVRDLLREGRGEEVPRYIVVSDFANFALYDLEPEDQRDLPLFDTGRPYNLTIFPLIDLHKHVRDFAFVRGEKPLRLDPENPANLVATQLLADLHDALETAGYSGHALERYLVRILFCLFAEDTGIFEPQLFTQYIKLHSKADGSDLGRVLAELFEVLDSDPDRGERMRGLDEDLAAFPYVNGALFKERLRSVAFNRDLRDALFKCCNFLWAKISPAVFGSLFQNVMGKGEEGKRERRNLGAHYTSERDIMKVLRGLFLDELRTKLDGALADRSTRRTERLRDFQTELRRLRVLDPACGCGNFLILAYREIRRLETEALVALYSTKLGGRELHLNVRELAQVDVDQFYGIEIQEWPARIAEMGLWLTDHQCNLELAEALGQRFNRLPLRATPTIRVANALRLDWRGVLAPSDDVIILGNPPFVGKKEQRAAQKDDIASVWGKGAVGAGVLDYVTCWYHKATEYIHDSRIRVGFVSPNSISQGEQVGVLWAKLLPQGVKIHFAHTTFAWQSEARGKAHVHVVIIGFGAFDTAHKTIFEYDSPNGEPHPLPANNINPYLADASDILIGKRTKPLDGAPKINYGSMMIDKPRDAGDAEGLIITEEERGILLAECPRLKSYIRKLVGGDEYINGNVRWCLWLVNAPPTLLRESPRLHARIERVRKFRASSGRPQTNELAKTPTLFGEIRQPSTKYLIIPKVSSETRSYIPVGFLQPDIIASGSALIIPGASNYHFGIISSAMHNAWMRCVGGRLESRYQYSSQIVYNNFPWPTEPSNKNVEAVENAAQAVLDTRAGFPASSLADLYDPLAMPATLTKAHAALDRAVDRCYRAEKFLSERARVDYLFGLYERLTAPIVAAAAAKPHRGRASPS